MYVLQVIINYLFLTPLLNESKNKQNVVDLLVIYCDQIKIENRKSFSVMFKLTSKSSNWVSYCYCLILIRLIIYLIQSNAALLAGPSPGDCGATHWAATYKFCKATLSELLHQSKAEVYGQGFLNTPGCKTPLFVRFALANSRAIFLMQAS